MDAGLGVTMRRFVVIGRTASASPDFSLVDLAGTSGRLDVLEPPHLGALIAKCAGQSPLPMPGSTGTPTTANTTESKE